MPYYPSMRDTRSYSCPNHRAWYASARQDAVRCAAYHVPGSCCHDEDEREDAHAT